MALCHAAGVIGHVFIRPPIGQAEFLTQGFPLSVTNDANKNLPIGCVKHVINGPGRNAFWHRRGRGAGNGSLRDMLANQKGSCFIKRGPHIRALASILARQQGRQNADHAKQRARYIDHRSACAQRAATWARHIGKAPHHLCDLIERGAVFVGAREKSLAGLINNVWLNFADGFISKAQFVKRPIAEIFNHYI